MNPGAVDSEEGPTPPPALGEDSSEAFVRRSAVMSVGTALSRATGFLRVAAMAFALGVAENRLADAYNVANTTPNIIYELALGGVLSSVFVPVFVERLQGHGREKAWRTARAVMTIALVFLVAVMVLGMAGSGWIIRLYTFRVSEAQRHATQELASFFLVWFMPQIVFYGLGAVATGLLNAHRRFAVPMFAPILNNLIVSATFFGFVALPGPSEPTVQGITTAQRYLLAIGTTAGVAAMSLALWPSLRRIGFRWRWTLDVRDEGLRRIGRLAGWAVVYVIINQVGYLLVIVLAAGVQGGYTAYTAAFIFFQLPHGIFAVSIMTALLPAMAAHWTAADRDGFRTTLSQGMRATALVVVPAAFGYLALSVPIVRLLLQHGVTGARSTDLVADILVFFALGLLPFSTFQLFLRAFYAMQDTRTPAVINVFAVGLNVAMNFVYFHFFDVRGLALGHATAYTFAAAAAGLIIKRRLGGLDGRRVLPAVGKIVVAGAGTGGAALVVSTWVGTRLGTVTIGDQLAQVGAGIGAGVAAFLLISAALRTDELSMLWRVIVGRLGRG